MINFKEVNKTYLDSIVALDDINLSIEEKEFTFITGPSGAGKSTLVRLLIREERPTQGEIFFEEVDVVNLPKKFLPEYRQQIGVSFQDLKLIESRTVRENIEFALEIIDKHPKEIGEITEYLLDLVNLKERADLLPICLSGGERQKIAIARALASEPKALIADEPTGNLDPKSTGEILDILKSINDIDTTVLVITHDESIVNNLNTRVVTLDQGKIVSDKVGGYKYQKTSKKDDKKEEREEKEEKKEKKEKRGSKKNETSKTEKKESKKEKEQNEIEMLELPKEVEEKLLANGIDELDKLLDLTESQIKKKGITEEDLNKITSRIEELNNLREK